MAKPKSEPTFESSLERLQQARGEAVAKAVTLLKTDHKDMVAVDLMIASLNSACSRAVNLKQLHFAGWHADGTPREKVPVEVVQ